MRSLPDFDRRGWSKVIKPWAFDRGRRRVSLDDGSAGPWNMEPFSDLVARVGGVAGVGAVVGTGGVAGVGGVAGAAGGEDAGSGSGALRPVGAQRFNGKHGPHGAAVLVKEREEGYDSRPPGEAGDQGEVEDLADGTRASVDRGYLDGYAAGLAMGRAEMEAEMKPILEAARAEAGRVMAEAEAIREKAIQGTRGVIQAGQMEIVRLAVAIAQKILLREISLSPQGVLHLASHVLAPLRDLDGITLRANPVDVPTLRAREKELPGRGEGGANPGLRIVPDNRVEQGGCVVETPMGEVDARIGIQLKNIERRLRREAGLETEGEPEGESRGEDGVTYGPAYGAAERVTHGDTWDAGGDAAERAVDGAAGGLPGGAAAGDAPARAAAGTAAKDAAESKAGGSRRAGGGRRGA
ncbi:MAG: hypothetical protein HYY09_05420 [Firmicutes bacterium]|nr:hypothetical protein [Bacillota bacterium]